MSGLAYITNKTTIIEVNLVLHLVLLILRLPLGIINIAILHLINTVGCPCNEDPASHHYLIIVVVICSPNMNLAVLAHHLVTLVTPPNPNLASLLLIESPCTTLPLVTMITPHNHCGHFPLNQLPW